MSWRRVLIYEGECRPDIQYVHQFPAFARRTVDWTSTTGHPLIGRASPGSISTGTLDNYITALGGNPTAVAYDAEERCWKLGEGHNIPGDLWEDYKAQLAVLEVLHDAIDGCRKMVEEPVE